MAIFYEAILFSTLFFVGTECGICFTKMIASSCFTDTSYFMADSGYSCCIHYDAMGYIDNSRPSYDFNIQTNSHTASCTPCQHFVEKNSVVCFNRARHNACWSVQRERSSSPKACCENNLDGGFATNLTLSVNSEGYIAHHVCTPCNRLHKTTGWTEWSPFSRCSVSCGHGMQQRHRSCLIPPQIGLCEGGDMETLPCITKNCINLTIPPKIQSTWSEWTVTSFCNASCGPGNRIRQRQCIIAFPTSNCSGPSFEHEPCLGTSCYQKNKTFGRILLVAVGGSCMATLGLIGCVCIYWKLKTEESSRLPQLLNNQRPKRTQSMQVAFTVACQDEEEQGIDNLAVQYEDEMSFNNILKNK